MLKRYWKYCGLIASVLYILTTVLGAAIRPGYSHITHAISELTEAGAPNKLLLDVLYILYNLLLTLFGLGFTRFVKERKAKRTGIVGAWMLVSVGLLGLLMALFFPMDPRDTPATSAGTVHLVLAGLLSLGTILSTLLIGLWLRKTPDLKILGTYTLVTCVVVIVSGGFAAGSAATASPIMGLAERITIGAFLQWPLVFGLWVREK